MTTTLVISAQSVGTGTNKGNGLFSIAQVALQATTTAFVVSGQLTNGAGPVDPNQQIRIWYSPTPWTVTAGNAAAQLNKTARYVDIKPNPNASAVTITDSSLEPVTGANFNLWVDAPTFAIAGALSVNLVELP